MFGYQLCPSVFRSFKFAEKRGDQVFVNIAYSFKIGVIHLLHWQFS
jgi:hypothetical protein